MKKSGGSRKLGYDENFVGLTQKMFALLEALSQQPKAGVPLDELTDLSGLPKTTVHRLLYSMNKIGYVEQDPVTSLYAVPDQPTNCLRSPCADPVSVGVARPAPAGWETREPG
jgi:hypothetical protein